MRGAWPSSPTSILLGQFRTTRPSIPTAVKRARKARCVLRNVSNLDVWVELVELVHDRVRVIVAEGEQLGLGHRQP